MITKKDLTIHEKLKLLTGKNLWQTEDLEGKIPSIFFADGPHGLRKMQKNQYGYYQNIPSNAYPNAVNLANSWSEKRVKEVAELIAEDCIENEIDILLAPGVNVKRTPLCGRNFEYYSEDPYLSGTIARSFIDGLQKRGVGTCVKHFAVNNREIGRYCITSEVSERALHEIYLKAFKIALKSNPMCVMSSYNPVNGVYASENKKLLKEILRGELGYNGLIISDWMGVKNGYKALKAGTDLRMPYAEWAYDELLKAYEEKLITDEEIDKAVSKILETIAKLETMQKKHKITYSRDNRREVSLATAEESIVLLKNEGVLPLSDRSICVIGEPNVKPYAGGGGAAQVQSDYVQRPLSEHLSNLLGREVKCSTRVKIDGLDPSHNDREGVLLASKCDVAIVVVGNGAQVETEGKDRDFIRLCKKDEMLITSVAKTGVKTVVIVEAGSAVDVSPWIDLVDGLIFAGFLGDNANKALANILTGRACPSGKLSETFPLSLKETYTGEEAGEGGVEVYDDGIFVGYRYYDSFNVPVRYPFGFGLSYAEFTYSNLNIEKIEETAFKVSYEITNVSNVDGMEVSQIYVSDPVCMVKKPEKELKAFKKTLVKAGETVSVSLELNEDAFSHYDVIEGRDYVENGEFYILVGASSKDIRLKGKVTVTLPDSTQHSVY